MSVDGARLATATLRRSPEQRELLGPGRTLHFHPSDTDPMRRRSGGRLTGETIVWRRAHEKVAVAVRGPLTNLLQVIYRRRLAHSEDIEVPGDVQVARLLAGTGRPARSSPCGSAGCAPGGRGGRIVGYRQHRLVLVDGLGPARRLVNVERVVGGVWCRSGLRTCVRLLGSPLGDRRVERRCLGAVGDVALAGYQVVPAEPGAVIAGHIQPVVAVPAPSHDVHTWILADTCDSAESRGDVLCGGRKSLSPPGSPTCEQQTATAG